MPDGERSGRERGSPPAGDDPNVGTPIPRQTEADGVGETRSTGGHSDLADAVWRRFGAVKRCSRSLRGP